MINSPSYSRVPFLFGNLKSNSALREQKLGWESVQASDFILESGLEQEFVIRPRAGFDASLPEVVPDPSASPPQEWDEVTRRSVCHD